MSEKNDDGRESNESKEVLSFIFIAADVEILSPVYNLLGLVAGCPPSQTERSGVSRRSGSCRTGSHSVDRIVGLFYFCLCP